MKSAGSLVIVGTGIKAVAHITIEAAGHVQDSDKLYYLVADPVTEHWLRSQNASAEGLNSCYADRKPRMDSYNEMIDRMLTSVREGKRVCAAFYGHPGIFVYPSHEAVRRAREEGYDAAMLPGISAEDCLFADLLIDPAQHGCASFEATDFLLFNREFDERSGLVLWQVGLVGERDFRAGGYRQKGLTVLIERLLETYPVSQELTLYEAAQYPVCDPRIDVTTLEHIERQKITPITTLYIPPLARAKADERIVHRLNSVLSAP